MKFKIDAALEYLPGEGWYLGDITIQNGILSRTFKVDIMHLADLGEDRMVVTKSGEPYLALQIPGSPGQLLALEPAKRCMANVLITMAFRLMSQLEHTAKLKIHFRGDFTTIDPDTEMIMAECR